MEVLLTEKVKPKILIVDDEELLLKGTQRLMQSAGYETVAAEDGEQALKALDALVNQLPDLVLLDVDLPGINGREVCRRIRSDPRFEGVYVVMLSSTEIASDDQILGLEEGADGYIGRPVPNRELLARVKAMLRLKASEESLRQSSNLQMEQRKNESLGIMAGGVAHDFNNLLAMIIGNIELAQDAIHGNPLAGEALTDALEACLWATAITKKFLLLSHSNTAQLEPGDLRDAIHDAISRLSCPHSIEIGLQVPEDLPHIRFDEEQLPVALSYLLNNAVEAMPHGGRLDISVQRTTPSNVNNGVPPKGNMSITVIIQDSGHGIPDKILPKVFDPYFSTKEMGPQKGMGLGLTTANAIIVQHGGSIDMETDIGKGTKVTVRLPLRPD
jgi:signal transduction histidine kinase